ncbi:MAG: RNA polymerase sigma factor [Pirellulaceae bacterium]
MKDDAQLVRDAQAGDADALGQLIERYQDRLYSCMIQVTGSPHESLDVLQDTFIQMLGKIDTLKDPQHFFTWLYRIAFNRAMTKQRNKRPTVSIHHDNSKVADEIEDTQPAAEAQLQSDELQQQVLEAVAQLDEPFRKVIILREMEDLDYETIAEILEISVGTVRSRLHRARSQLRDVIRIDM